MKLYGTVNVVKIFLFKSFKVYLPSCFFEPLTSIASPSAQVPACYETAETTVFGSFNLIKMYLCRRKRFGGLNSKEK